MSLETVSTKRNRVYRRKFDHEEAQARFKAGESPKKLAQEYGVSEQSVRRVCIPEVRAAMNLRSQMFLMSGTCIDCGKQGISKKSPRCNPCAAAEARTSVRPTELRCGKCQKWKPDAEFYRSKSRRDQGRRGRKHQCKACDNEARLAYRRRQKVPCPGCGRPTSPPDSTDRRRETLGMCPTCTLSGQLERGELFMAVEGTFVVMVKEGDNIWRELGRPMARDKRDALDQVLNGDPPKEDVVVISAQAFRPGKVVPRQVWDIEVAEAEA